MEVYDDCNIFIIVIEYLHFSASIVSVLCDEKWKIHCGVFPLETGITQIQNSELFSP